MILNFWTIKLDIFTCIFNKTFFKKIYDLKINDILVEAGGIFLSNLLKNDLVDEIHLFKAPIIIGSSGKPFLIGKKLKDIKYKEVLTKNFDHDIYRYLSIVAFKTCPPLNSYQEG